MSIVRYERISKLVTAAGGLAGGSLIGIGLFFAIPTMGVSLALSAAGGAVSSLSVHSSLISSLALKIKANSHLKKAQQFVKFDQAVQQPAQCCSCQI